jgi:hypothetical protein
MDIPLTWRQQSTSQVVSREARACNDASRAWMRPLGDAQQRAHPLPHCRVGAGPDVRVDALHLFVQSMHRAPSQMHIEGRRQAFSDVRATRRTFSLCLATSACTCGSSSCQMPKLLSGPPTFVLPVPPLPRPGLNRSPTLPPGNAAPYASSWCKLCVQGLRQWRAGATSCSVAQRRACTRSASCPPG